MGGRRNASGPGGRDGPVAIPRGERIQLKSFNLGAGNAYNGGTDADDDDDGGVFDDRANAMENPNNSHNFTNQAAANNSFVANAAAAVAAAAPLNHGSSTATSISNGRESSGVAADGMSALLRLAKISQGDFESKSNEDQEQPQKVVLPPAEEAARSPTWYGQTLEYAAGYALKSQVLQPVQAELGDGIPHDHLELSRLMSLYSRGQLLLLRQGTEITHGSIRRVSSDDSRTLGTWWRDDKFLSYTSEEWSDWWIRRCHLFDPGCEMIQLIDATGQTLGVAYFERNLVDTHCETFSPDSTEKPRITLIRGIRLDPRINPEAVRRSSFMKENTLYEQEVNAATTSTLPCRGIASLLMAHILFTSLRYGTNTVAVNCPKNEVAERFYESFMGPPIGRDFDTGRRYYRMSPELRYVGLRKAFRKQIEFLMELSQMNGGAPSATAKLGEPAAVYVPQQLQQPGLALQDAQDEDKMKRRQLLEMQLTLQDAQAESKTDHKMRRQQLLEMQLKKYHKEHTVPAETNWKKYKPEATALTPDDDKDTKQPSQLLKKRRLPTDCSDTADEETEADAGEDNNPTSAKKRQKIAIKEEEKSIVPPKPMTEGDLVADEQMDDEDDDDDGDNDDDDQDHDDAKSDEDETDDGGDHDEDKDNTGDKKEKVQREPLETEKESEKQGEETVDSAEVVNAGGEEK